MDVTESRHQRCLIYALFAWVTILSLALAVALTLIFTALPQPPENVSFSYVPSQEFTISNATGDSGKEKAILPWVPIKDFTEELLSVQREHLVVKSNWEGFYFLYLQVTLQYNNDHQVAPIIRVQQGDRTLLESVPTRNLISEPLTTGFLGRRVILYSRKNITVSCSPASLIDTTETATYLGVYLLKRT